MLVQDTMTGYFHEVPDYHLSESDYEEYPEQLATGEVTYDGLGNAGEVIYDGLGNPVGFLPFLPAIGALAAKALPAVAGAVGQALPAVGSLIGRLPLAFGGRAPFPGAGGLVSQLPGLLQRFLPGGGAPPAPPVPAPALRLPFVRPPLPYPRPPWPLGWIRPPLPYTGLGPKRLYMRCAVWPGPRGLVPAFAPQMPPVPPAPPVPPMPGVGPVPFLRRRRRRRR
jgi:hypothetical protein